MSTPSYHRRTHRASVAPAATMILVITVAALIGNTTPSVRSLQAAPAPAPALATQENYLAGAVDWINTAEPIRAGDLIGKVVLLDFWTYCCINCHHIIPDLEKLEAKYADELVVIGVHSPKFEAERDTENIRKKVREYEIKHPIANDANMVLWNRFGVDTWPTLAIIDARGNPRGKVRGEGHLGELDSFIGKLVAEHRAQGELDETPFVVYAESDRPSDGPLLFPGKILADEPGGRLFIADTGHNRVVVTDLEGTGQFTIGGGVQGLKDGSFAEAQFNRPQGLCLIDGMLYVADTENHAIRRVDIEGRTVRTIAGDGTQSNNRSGQGRASASTLNSPWDVIQVPGKSEIIIAMAGPHQLWRLDLEKDEIRVWAGSGVENIVDGTYKSAAFAQPSGLATDGQFLYVADSEVSGIRRVALEPGPGQEIDTVVGLGLFKFGDVDGRGDRVRLQHCLGLAYGGGFLFIADTYNNKIKACMPAERAVKTIAGTKQPGSSDEAPSFYQPGGLSIAGETLYVADTNNHLVRAFDLKAETVRTLPISGISPPKPPASAPKFPRAVPIAASPAEVSPGDGLELVVDLDIPGFKLQPDSPVLYFIEAPDNPEALGDVSPTGTRVVPEGNSIVVPVPLASNAESGDTMTLKLSASVFACAETGGFCTLKQFAWTVPVTFTSGAGETVRLTTADAATDAAE